MQVQHIPTRGKYEAPCSWLVCGGVSCLIAYTQQSWQYGVCAHSVCSSVYWQGLRNFKLISKVQKYKGVGGWPWQRTNKVFRLCCRKAVISIAAHQNCTFQIALAIIARIIPLSTIIIIPFSSVRPKVSTFFNGRPPPRSSDTLFDTRRHSFCN